MILTRTIGRLKARNMDGGGLDPCLRRDDGEVRDKRSVGTVYGGLNSRLRGKDGRVEIGFEIVAKRVSQNVQSVVGNASYGAGGPSRHTKQGKG